MVRSVAKSTTTSSDGNIVTHRKVIVKNNIFGRKVVKEKTMTDVYAPIAAGGRVYQGTTTTRKKRVSSN